MLKKITEWSTIHYKTTTIIAAMIAIAGIFAITAMKVDVLPDINKPTVALFAEADGLAPEEIERLVLTPLENAVLGTPGVDRVRGVASFGLAIVNIEFSWGTDIYRNRQLIQERIARVALPDRAKVALGPISSVMGEVVWVGVTGANVSGTDLRTYADWTLRPNLLRTKGVSDVIVMGGDVAEWQVRLNADAMTRLGITQEMVNDLLRINLVNTSGGLLVQQGKEYPVRIFVAPESFENLEALPILAKNGEQIRLGEIASFMKSASTVRGTAAIDGEHGVVLRIFKQPDAETLAVTKDIDALVAEANRNAPQGIRIASDLFRQEWFISAGLKNVEEALRDAFIIVGIVVFLFLAKLRPTAITLLSIPASLSITAIVFYAMGLSVNVMTLGGIAVAIGDLVDNAIVSVENIGKRLRERRRENETRISVIISAIDEISGSAVEATVLILLVFAPVFFLQGVEGKLLSSLALAYITSLIASLAVSLTLVPALAALLGGKDEYEEKPARLALWLELGIDRILRRIMGQWKLFFVMLVTMVVSTGALYAFAGKEGIPTFNEDSLTISAVLPTGTGLETTSLYVQTVGDAIKSLPFVTRVSHITGRAGADPHDSGSNTSEIQIVLAAGSAEKIGEYIPRVQEVLDIYTGAQFSIGKPITHRVEELLSGVRAPIVIKIYGTDIDAMRSYGRDIVVTLGRISGVMNPQLSRDVKVPEIHVYPDTQVLLASSASPGTLGEEVESGFLGNKVGEMLDGLRRIPVVTKLDNESRNSFAGFRDTVFGEIGGTIGSAGSVEFNEGRNRVSHEGGKRVIVISANYEGRDVVGAVDTLKKSIESMQAPENTTLSYEGTYKSQKENSMRLAILFGIAILLIALVLYRSFPSIILVGQIMANIPTALFGGIVAVWLTGGSINLAHLVGFISLAGIVSRNGIILLARALEITRTGERYLTDEIIIEATRERIVPILMTSVGAALALAPLLINGNAPGKEFLHPLAVVMMGGLITSTITSLLFMPVLLGRTAKDIRI